MDPSPATPVYERLKIDLRQAMARRETRTVQTIRSLLSAVDNAGAVPLDRTAGPVVGKLADVPRRSLSEDTILEILEAEAEERRSAIAEYDALGLTDAAATLRAELEVVTRYL